jgi:hypothetical protein
VLSSGRRGTARCRATYDECGRCERGVSELPGLRAFVSCYSRHGRTTSSSRRRSSVSGCARAASCMWLWACALVGTLRAVPCARDSCGEHGVCSHSQAHSVRRIHWRLGHLDSPTRRRRSGCAHVLRVNYLIFKTTEEPCAGNSLTASRPEKHSVGTCAVLRPPVRRCGVLTRSCARAGRRRGEFQFVFSVGATARAYAQARRLYTAEPKGTWASRITIFNPPTSGGLVPQSGRPYEEWTPR